MRRVMEIRASRRLERGDDTIRSSALAGDVVTDVHDTFRTR
jgi:hypothetical protein